MKWLPILLIFLITDLHASAQTDKIDNFPLFRQEVKSFIDSAKAESMWHAEHNVYIVDMHNSGADSNSFCFSIWYIMLAQEYGYAEANCKYIFTIDNEIILINAADRLINKWKNNNYIIKIDSASRKIFEKRLNRDAGLIDDYRLGRALGLLCWFDGKNIKKKFFDQSVEIDRITNKYGVPEYFSGDTIPAMKTVPIPKLPKSKASMK